MKTWIAAVVTGVVPRRRHVEGRRMKRSPTFVSVLFLLASCLPTPPQPPAPPAPDATAAQVVQYERSMELYREAVKVYNAQIEQYAKLAEKGQALGPIGQMVGPWGEAIAAILGIAGAMTAAHLRKKKIGT